MKFCIYALIDPRSAEVFYVGRTSNYGRRIAQHMEGTDQLSGLIVGQIKTAGFLPHVVVLERVKTLDQCCMAEIFWIELMSSRGAMLANSQGFSGYVERGDARDEEAAKLKAMEDLKALSNGRPGRSCKRWSGRDEKRLAGMVKVGMSPEAMADALSRTPAEIKAKIKGPQFPAGLSEGRTRREGLTLVWQTSPQE